MDKKGKALNICLFVMSLLEIDKRTLADSSWVVKSWGLFNYDAPSAANAP